MKTGSLLYVCFINLKLAISSVSLVKYEARLEDGTVISKSEGVEFTVTDGWYSMNELCFWNAGLICLLEYVPGVRSLLSCTS